MILAALGFQSLLIEAASSDRDTDSKVELFIAGVALLLILLIFLLQMVSAWVE